MSVTMGSGLFSPRRLAGYCILVSCSPLVKRVLVTDDARSKRDGDKGAQSIMLDSILLQRVGTNACTWLEAAVNSLIHFISFIKNQQIIH